MVNFDWDDVSVPIASTSWNTPSEVLVAQNWWDINSNKLYYFSPFEQYSEDEKTWEVSSIDQDDNIDNKLSQDKNLSTDWKVQKRKEFKSKLKDMLYKAKNEAKDYKKSDNFKAKKKDLKDKKQTIPKDEYSYKILPLANAAWVLWNWWTWYVAPSNASNTFVPWVNYSWCNWKLPCYEQFQTTYNWQTCDVWCVPTAFAMIYWYYDRNWTYPDLITWTAPNVNSSTIESLIKNLWQNYMSTYCSAGVWLTSIGSWMLWIQYAKNLGYTKSSATYCNTNLFSTIKSEINAWRPIIANVTWHALVRFWYFNTTDSTKQIIRVNLWWWAYYNMTDSSGNPYFWSNIDYNINSLYFWWTNRWGITSLIKILISK